MKIIGFCETCLYMREEYHPNGNKMYCVRRPPKMGELIADKWPRVELEDFCGEYQKHNDQCDRCEHNDIDCYLPIKTFFEKTGSEGIPEEKSAYYDIVCLHNRELARRRLCKMFVSKETAKNE